jgi:hypothetical protein
VYIISSDTLVETPLIVNYIKETLDKIEQRANETGLPFRTEKLTPRLDDTFWVNLIGRGYPAPTSIFRWCSGWSTANIEYFLVIEADATINRQRFLRACFLNQRQRQKTFPEAGLRARNAVPGR